MSIATAITDLKGRIETAYGAIEGMGGTSPSDKNSYNLPAAIQTIPQGGDEPVQAVEEEVLPLRFIDYDGSTFLQFTRDEALNLEALPPAPQPTPEGLVFQEWNYTLAEMKDNIRSMGMCDVGATYTTTDGKTHLFINLIQPLQKTVQFHFNQTNADGVQVDWGDSTAVETYNTAGDVDLTHTYSSIGKYEIKINVASGTMSFNRSAFLTTTDYYNAAILEKAFIGNSVTGIGNNAFQNCGNLEYITIAKGVTSIGSYPFNYSTKLTGLVLPKGVDTLSGTIGSFLVKMTSISLPPTVTSIPQNLLNYNYVLSRLVIPNGVTVINPQSQSWMRNMTLPNSLTTFSQTGYTFFRKITVPQLICSSQVKTYFVGAYNLIEDVEICNEVTSIESNTFQGCTNIKKIAINSAVTSIQTTFPETYKQIEEVVIKEGVTSIGAGLLQGCSAVKKLYIPNTVETINANAFDDCVSLEKVSIPQLIASQKLKDVFPTYKQLTEVVIQEGVTTMPTNISPLEDCLSIDTLSIPNTLPADNFIGGTNSTAIEKIVLSATRAGSTQNNAWNGIKKNAVKEVVVKYGGTSLCDNLFNGMSPIKKVTIPKSITTIGASCFSSCYNLKDIVIPYGVTELNSGAFYRCRSLKKIEIPETVTTLGSGVFTENHGLEELTIPESVTTTTTGNGVYYNIGLKKLMFKGSGERLMKCNENWFLTSVTIPEGVTTIQNDSFKNDYCLPRIEFPNSLTIIYNEAFANCSACEVYDFSKATSIPALNQVNVFNNTLANKKIIVPDNLYDNWKRATNWSSTTNNIVNCIVKAPEA